MDKSEHASDTKANATEDKATEGKNKRTSTENRAVPFLAAFNDIEQHFRAHFQAKHSEGFGNLVRRAEDKHLISEGQARLLHEFADLRNCISHGSYGEDLRPIAEPLPEAVREISHLRDLITHPPLALSVLGNHEVITLYPDSPIADAFNLIRDKGISQFPVYDQGKFLALLSTNTIARWVAKDYTRGLDGATVGEVLECAEASETVGFLNRHSTVREVLEYFTTPTKAKGGGIPTAIILTEHGKRTQKPFRIITRGDLPTLVEAVEINAAES